MNIFEWFLSLFKKTKLPLVLLSFSLILGCSFDKIVEVTPVVVEPEESIPEIEEEEIIPEIIPIEGEPLVETTSVTLVEKPVALNKQLSKNFNIADFKCKDGTTVPDALYANVFELAQNLQVLSDALGKPINVISGYRSPDYNKKVGGAKNSQHLYARAGDIKVNGISPSIVADTIESLIKAGKMKQGGLGRYPTSTHYDVRRKKARW
jgi:hypothetical protein